MSHFRTSLALAVLAALLSACGGGGGSSAIPSSGSGSGSSPTQPAQKTGPANLTISIPPASKQNTHFRPGYISAGTQSMTVGLVTGSTTTSLATVNLTQSSPNCTVPAGGGLQCTTTVQAPFGTDTFVVSTYSGLNGAGSVLSTGQVQTTLTLGATEPTVQLDLDGVPVTVALVLGTATLPVGYAGSTSVIVQAQDASGNLIIGPGEFSTPIDLAISGDTYSTLSLSSSSVTSPGQAVTLSYNGGTNVGATITPSGSGITGAPVTFNATGGTLNLFQYYDSANEISLETYDLAALSNGTAAIVSYVEDESTDFYPEGIVIAAPTAVQKIYVGETTDFYNPVTTATPEPGLNVIPGMSEYIDYHEFNDGGSYDNVAAANGFVYYSGQTDSPEDSPSCPDGTLETGTIGKLNASAGTTQEYVLSGYPGPIKVDGSGNAWFIETTGTCTQDDETSLISGDGYAVGELTAAGTVIETPFANAELTGIEYPSDMAINAAGTQMYITDYDSATVTKIAIPALSAPAGTMALTNSRWPYSIAAASDGTIAWSSDDDRDDLYYYGFLPASATFGTTSPTEPTFPISDFYSYTVAYADGSFWMPGPSDEASGFGRISGIVNGSTTPVNGYYPPPTTEDDEVELYGISAGGGYVWSADPCQGTIYVLQYGAPSSGVITYTSRRIGMITFRTAAQMQRPSHQHHAANTHAHRTAPLDPIDQRLLQAGISGR
jgi:hypothetical protein